MLWRLMKRTMSAKKLKEIIFFFHNFIFFAIFTFFFFFFFFVGGGGVDCFFFVFFVYKKFNGTPLIHLIHVKISKEESEIKRGVNVWYSIRRLIVFPIWNYSPNGFKTLVHWTFISLLLHILSYKWMLSVWTFCNVFAVTHPCSLWLNLHDHEGDLSHH